MLTFKHQLKRMCALSNIRRRLHEQFDPHAWQQDGLSPVNRFVCFAVLIAVFVAIIETEPTISAPNSTLFLWLEVIFATLFITEYIARLYAAGENPRFAGVRGRLRYMVTPGAIIDALALLPSILSFGAYNGFLLRVLRVVRLLRVARLGRVSTAWDALAEALHRRRYELGLSGGVAVMLLIFSSGLLYLVEGDAQPETFGSIPRALWWSVATLTTVGYGDVTPITVLGKFLAGFTAIAGIGLIAMPTGILAAAFSDAFQSRSSKK